MKVCIVFGTRPEAIKMCPLIIEMKKYKQIKCIICLTGQHKEMLKQVMESFSIEEDYNLAIMQEKQSLSDITSNVIHELEIVFAAIEPDIVLVHGDTTTSFAAALAAFYQKIPVGHVEAGLRTGNIYSPYPEELNRQLTSRIATYHFAPTELNKENLKMEGILNNVFVTGNTVIDSFYTTIKEDYLFQKDEIRNIDFSHKKVILVTAHRRENIGEPLKNICDAIKDIVHMNDVIIVFPVHPNPRVKNVVYQILRDEDRVILTEPLNVFDMHNLMSRCYLVMTDSGGLQEEAPTFGKPVLVLRTETERPEAVKAGTVEVIGVEKEGIVRAVNCLLSNHVKYRHMAQAVNPYGDGKASERICEIICKLDLHGNAVVE